MTRKAAEAVTRMAVEEFAQTTRAAGGVNRMAMEEFTQIRMG